MQKLILSGLAALLLVFASCSRQAPQNGDWHPNTEKLDELVLRKPEITSFARDVKAFYENLHYKRWADAYKQRSPAFRKLFPEALYLKKAGEMAWSLDDYEVLSWEVRDNSHTILICKFIEGPIDHTSYNSVAWTLENGAWTCDRAGPTRSAVLLGTQ